ncbi:MAG: hypothetical protein LQ349_009039, partial [Xanthoria aureola]
RIITTTPTIPASTDTNTARFSPPKRAALPVNGEGAGIPPVPVTDPLEDPLTPCTPPVMLAVAAEEALLATNDVAVEMTDCTDPLNAGFEV